MDSSCRLCVYWDLQGIVSGGSLPPGDFSTWDGGVGMSKTRAFYFFPQFDIFSRKLGNFDGTLFLCLTSRFP